MAENLICGATEVKGGEYEWVCTRPPHEPRRNPAHLGSKAYETPDHYMIPFKKIA